MKTELKLDAAAMTALFPEGTEVRLQLQQAVISEVVRKVIDREVTQTTNLVKQLVQEEIRKILPDRFTTYRGAITLTDSAKEQIKTEVNAAYVLELRSAIAACARPTIEAIEKRLSSSFDETIRIRLNAMAKEALREALK